MKKFIVILMTLAIAITVLIYGIANFNNGKIKRPNPITDNPTTERERYMPPEKQDATEILERKLSLPNIVSYSKVKIDQLAHIEKLAFNVPAGHELLFLHSHQKLRLLNLIGIDLSRKPHLDRIYSIELLNNNKDGYYLASVWAVHATSSTISVYIDMIKRQNDYKETKHGQFTIHSLPLIDPWVSQPYESISFYYDRNSIIIGSLDDLKIILDNQDSQNVWSALDSEHSLAHFTVNDLQIYSSLTSGIIGAFDYDTFIKEIESFSVDIVEVEKDKSLQINLTVNTINEKTSSDSFYSELTTFKELLINRLKVHPKTNVLLNSIKAIKINQQNNEFTAKIPITVELFDFFNDNLITNIQSLILAFPGILFADKYPAVNYQPTTNQDVNDEIKTNLASYRERYRPIDSPKPRSDDFHKYSRSPNPYAHYRRSNIGSLLNLGISKIWFYDEQETQLAFEIEFQNMYPYESDWMTQHFKIGTLQFNTESQKIEPRTSYKETQENRLLKKSALLTKGVMHRELTSITFNAHLPVPKGVSSIVFTKDDLGKRVSIGQENTSIKLTSFEKHSISYIHTGPRHNIVEVRAFNKNSEALEVPSESTREEIYHNDQISTLKEYGVDGNIEFVEIFYVTSYSQAYSGKTSISSNIKSSVFPDGKHGLPLEPISYKRLKEKHYDKTEKKWILPPLSDYDARDVKSGKYYSTSAGPVRIFIESKSSSEIYVSTKFNGPAEKSLTTPNFLRIDIQQVIIDGVVHKRPSEQQIAELEDNRNVNYNGYTKINWTISPHFSFHETGIDAVHTAPLGIKVSSDSSIEAFKANVTLLIPEQIETQTFKSIYVGDIISGDGYSYKVIKFENGRFFIRLDEGADKFISIRASLNNEKIIDNDIKYEQANIVSIAPVSEKHSYRFLIASKVHKEVSTLQYGEFK